MATEVPDVYVKFGETPGAGSERLPWIEGDSDDDAHFWWCELKDCGFNLENPDELLDGEVKSGDGDDNKATESKSWFQPVTLTKRVDWASTQLFMKCCEAPEATTKMSDGANMCDTDKVKGWIDQVTVEVCRPAAGEKIPFVIIRYYGVKVTNYEVSITEPEPSETIKFEFEELELEYQQTDPFTGARKGGAIVTKRLTNRPASQNTTSGPAKGGSGAASPGASPDGSGGAVSAGTGASAAVAVAASNGNGSSAALVSATDGAVRANFPALWSENGFGLLPD